MKKTKFFDLLSLLKYAVVLFIYVLFNSIENPTVPYSTAFMVAFSTQENLPFISVILYILSFVITKDFGLLPSTSISGFCILIISLIYKRIKISAKYEYSLFALISLLGYIFLGDIYVESVIEKRIFSSLIISVLSFLSIIALKAISNKLFRFKFGEEEYCSIAVIFVCLGLGLSNLISPYVWKAIICLTILLSSCILSNGKSVIISCVTGVS